jgi:anti-sigma factor RsiW
MDHFEATQSKAVEKYLLGEMSALERDEFEVHFFDCPECAADLRATAAFLDTAKQELKSFPRSKPASEAKRSRSVLQWKPVFAWTALAASLLVTAYQNIVVYPHLTNEIAELKAPEILPSLSLVNGNSRGSNAAAIRPGSIRLAMVRAELGCNVQGNISASVVGPGGSGFPP